MELKLAFAAALRAIRLQADLSQEAFSSVSSRTYISTLERGIKGPTIEKVSELSAVMCVHPLTLLTQCYLEMDSNLSLDSLFQQVREELSRLSDVGSEPLTKQGVSRRKVTRKSAR